MRGQELLTAEQRQEFMQIPADNDWDLGTYYTFSQYDLDIINVHRRAHNRLGFAVQLAVIRYPGWPLSDLKTIPDSMLNYIANQIDVDPVVFPLYAQRETTRREHMVEIRQTYGYQNFTEHEYLSLSRIMVNYALENGNALYLIRLAIEELRKQKIILPAITTIERVVWESRQNAEDKIFNILVSSLSMEQKNKLELILSPMPQSSKTYLAWLREIPGTCSPDAFLKVLQKLEYLRDLQLQIDTKGIHPNRLRQLSKIGARYESQAFSRFKDPKKSAVLIAYLIELIQDLTDRAFEIHDRQIMLLLSKGRKSQEEIQKRNGKSINERVVHLADLGAALIKARNEGIDPYVALEAVMPWEQLVQSVEEAKQLARPIDYDFLDLLETKFYNLRKYTPALLKSFEFRSTKSMESLLKAVDIIRDMNETGKRKVPEGAPLDFIPGRWQKHVYDDDGMIDRHYYEMAVLSELRNHVRSGDITIVGSRQHKDFEEYLVSQEEWSQTQPSAIKLAVSMSAEEYLEERTDSLLKRLQWVSSNVDGLEGVNLEDGKLHIDRLEKDVPDQARDFSLSLYGLLPRINLPDLLMDVAHWTGFHEQFIHASTNRIPNEEETMTIMATLMAMGTNIGLTKMAEATPGISYRQMANTAQWRLYEDAMNKAQAVLVNYHHRMALPYYWGDGRTSSSGGMRVQIGVPAIHADSNPHYGTGKGATIYRFVSDQFSSFHTKVVYTNVRDAVHVIDGLLHHETDLSIEEHYTDTDGYTDKVFGLMHLLGFRFAPRLRDLADSKLYTIGKASDFPRLEKILRGGQIKTKTILKNYDDVLRLAHSIREGTVSASLIMGKLGSYARQNSLAIALQEMGRIEKTIFLLDYISSEALRRKVHRGLNKGEAMNALARAIFFGRRGEFRERALQDQLQRASALNILINTISIWNTVYLAKAVEFQREKGFIEDDLLHHISPLGWEHINFLGEGCEYSLYQRQAVVITAPAGYGKTTLMVTALSGYQLKGCRICWYRLDEEDRDLAVFYTHLVETLFPEEEGVWAEPRSHLADCGDIFAQHQYLNALFCQELWAFHNLRPDVKTFIVFDDFQQVRDTHEITGAIQFFIDNLPDKCSVVVSSRWATGLPAGRRMLEKNILEITRSDLCFSEAELAGLIEKRFGNTPDQDLLRKIMLHTEGWAAGVVLICQMLNLNGADRADNFLDRIGNQEPLFHYMVAEILKTVDDRLLRFLVRAAILQEFTAAEAGAIFEEDSAAEQLRQCERQGLFIQKVAAPPGAGHPEATYRFHPLFRDALQQIQRQHLSTEESNNLHLRAAAYYIDHHNFDRAIGHFIACGSVDQAVALVTRESARLIALESLDQIRLWFRILPEAVVHGNGHLLFFQSYIYQHRDVGSALSLLEQALAIFQQTGDSAMQIHTLLAMARLYAQRQDMSGLRKIYALTPDLYQKVHGQPLVNMLAVFDFLVAVVEGRLARGAALYQRIGLQALTDEWQWAALFYSIMMYCLRGELNRAVSQGREALKLEVVGRSNLLKGYTLIYHSIVLQMRDESDPLMIDELMTIGARYEYKYMMGCSKRLTAYVCYRRHDLEGALEQLDAGTGYFEDLGNKALVSSNRLWRCLWLCGAQPASELLADAREALKYLIARRPDGYCLHEIGNSVFGAIAREAGEYELAEQKLTAAVRSSKAKGAKQILAGCLHLAKLYYDTGDPARGEDYLRQAFTLAVDNNYVMFWDMHFPTLVEMAARCVKSRIHAGYAQALIARYYGSEAAEFLGRTAPLTADDHLKDFAGAFLSRYGTHDESQAPRININLFGRFNITVNGITIPKNEWKTKKIAGVLKFLVVHRGRTVFKDRLMEVFWPEVDKKSAYMSLRAAYYELKKVLRKYGVATEGETWFLNEKRDSLEVRASSPLGVDVDSFLALSNELKTLPPNKNGSGQKITILERMVALYRGDYLEEDIYEDWTFAEREELKSIYFGSAIELANIYIMKGDKNKAEKLLLKILSKDPYNEEACLCCSSFILLQIREAGPSSSTPISQAALKRNSTSSRMRGSHRCLQSSMPEHKKIALFLAMR